jgi:hypothetical protein
MSCVQEEEKEEDSWIPQETLLVKAWELPFDGEFYSAEELGVHER